MITRDTVTAVTVIRLRWRSRSTSAMPASCADCAISGIAASRPMTNGPAPSASAKPTRMTPP
jgi:hypothetical protein